MQPHSTTTGPHVQPYRDFDDTPPRPICMSAVVDRAIADFFKPSAQARRGDPAGCAPEPISRPTWKQLCEIEPKLLAVEREAFFSHPSPSEFWRCYEKFKARLKQLVGFSARRPELATADAYSVAHKQIVTAMEEPLL